MPPHHASALTFEDVTAVDGLADLRKRNVECHRWGGARAIAPLVDNAHAALIVHDLIEDACLGSGEAERQIILQPAEPDMGRWVSEHGEIDGADIRIGRTSSDEYEIYDFP